MRMANCHPDKKHKAIGLCKYCYDKQWFLNNKKKRHQSNKQWRLNNKEYNRKRVKKYIKHKLELNPNYIRNQNIQHLHHISQSDYEALLKNQNYKCLGCNIDINQYGKNFVIDHCHTTNKIRGLLCSNCNISLGMAQDNPNILRNLANYLERM